MQRLETQLTDTEITRLDELLASIHAPLQPLDASAVDGYLCGALVQPVTRGGPEGGPAVFDADAQ
ncbi:MAG: YecA family protein, partial [Rubrivivax sp.]